MEKETLGLFLSSHPLKEVRAALRAHVECSIAALPDRKDNDWVTVGGVITEFRKIRTRKGDPMLFATLDDLEGQVEILVFNTAYDDNVDRLALDKVVIVRARIDKPSSDETKLVVQKVEAFEPTQQEVERAREVEAQGPAPPPQIHLCVAPEVPDTFLDDLRELVARFPGESELRLEVGARRLVLGPQWRVNDSSACRSDLVAMGVSIVDRDATGAAPERRAASVGE